MKIKSIFYLVLITSIVLSDFLIGQSSELNTIISRFDPPKDYKRIDYDNNSFANWIRNLPLKESNSEVLDYRGKIFKSRDDSTVAAVIDWNIQGKRLEQCMDILIRFYAEYLWEKENSAKLILPLPEGKPLKWLDWQEGFRPKFKGVNFDLIKSEKYNPAKNNFDKYLNLVFAESHTQQFYYAYPQIEREDVQVGGFIVKKGVKGHAVMIVDLAKNEEGELIALIGQGDTPACEFYLLNYQKDNPWIPLDFSKEAIPLPIKKKMTWDGLRRFE